MSESTSHHDNLRDQIGQALNDAIASGAPQADYCDSREVDRLADAVLAVLPPLRRKVELDPELKAALDKAAKTGALHAFLPSYGIVFINRGDEYSADEDLNCLVCGGSGHNDDAAPMLAQLLIVERQRDNLLRRVGETPEQVAARRRARIDAAQARGEMPPRDPAPGCGGYFDPLWLDANDDSPLPEAGAASVAPAQPQQHTASEPFAHFVQPSGFGPFVEVESSHQHAFPAYRTPQARQQVGAPTDEQIKDVAIDYAAHVADDIYDVTKYDCAEDFFNCVRACVVAAGGAQ